MPRSFERLTIDNVAGGAVKDLFEYEWARVLRDIADTTKKAKSPRSVTIKLKVTPTEDRGSGDVEVEVVSSLAKQKPSFGTAYFQSDGTRVESYIDDVKQEELVLETEEE